MMRCFGYRLNMTSSEQNGEFQTYLFGIPRLLFATHSTNTRNNDRKAIDSQQIPIMDNLQELLLLVVFLLL